VLPTTEPRRVLLLLTIAVIALILVQPALAQNSKPCAEGKLPSQLVNLIETKFSGWRPRQFSDLGSEDQQLWVKAHSNDCPGTAVGHFEGQDRLSYAVLLVPQSNPTGGYKLLVFNRTPSGDAYIWKMLDHANAAYSGLVIETAPPGNYSDYEDARISVTTKLDGFYLEWIEKGALLYYWSAGRYKTVRVSG
jgi:hypothetical protein